MNPVVLIVSSVLLGVVGQLALKDGVAHLGPLSLAEGQAPGAAWRIVSSPRIWLGLGLYGVSMLLWLLALAQVELSYAYPFLSLSYVLILLASWGLFHESISWLRLVGVVAICFGVYAVAAG